MPEDLNKSVAIDFKGSSHLFSPFVQHICSLIPSHRGEEGRKKLCLQHACKKFCQAYSASRLHSREKELIWLLLLRFAIKDRDSCVRSHFAAVAAIEGPK